MDTHNIKRANLNQLEEGVETHFSFSLSTEELTSADCSFSYKSPLKIKGKHYKTNDFLIIYFSANLEALRPCKICNEETSLPIEINNHTIAQQIDEIREETFDIQDTIRSYTLGEIPDIIECNNGQCPERASIEKYLKK